MDHEPSSQCCEKTTSLAIAQMALSIRMVICSQVIAWLLTIEYHVPVNRSSYTNRLFSKSPHVAHGVYFQRNWLEYYSIFDWLQSMICPAS